MRNEVLFAGRVDVVTAGSQSGLHRGITKFRERAYARHQNAGTFRRVRQSIDITDLRDGDLRPGVPCKLFELGPIATHQLESESPAGDCMGREPAGVTGRSEQHDFRHYCRLPARIRFAGTYSVRMFQPSLTGTIHLVRHGEVENPKGVIYGRLPGYNLSERGLHQAEQAGLHLSSADVGALWASPLERAQETAAAISTHHAVEIVTDERLIESHTTLEGVGRTIRALIRSPRHWWQFRNPWKPSWGEAFSEIRARMVFAVADAVEAAAGREVVVVSHQTPVLVARLALARRNTTPWIAGLPCQTGSVTTMVLDAGRVVGASYFVPSI